MASPEESWSRSTAPSDRDRDLQHQPASPSAIRPATDIELNLGQHGAEFPYVVRLADALLGLSSNGSVLVPTHHRGQGVESAPIRMEFMNPDPASQPLALERAGGRTHYFLGADPSHWITDVPHFRRVRFSNTYPGIDVEYRAAEDGLEYVFLLRPGAQPEAIQIRFDGAESIRVTDRGHLVIETGRGAVIHRSPTAFRMQGQCRETIPCRFVLASGPDAGCPLIGFQLGPHDPSDTVVIDPVLDFSTYLGAGSGEYARGIAVDGAGNMYVAGATISAAFPTLNPYQSKKGTSWDAFVTKIDSSGALVYSTFLGADGMDFAYDIAIDSDGNAYVTGETWSDYFPLRRAFQSTLLGSYDGFVTKLNQQGSGLVYSTYLGGSSTDYGNSIAVDASGSAYVVGFTYSTNFPTENPFQSGNPDTSAFVTKFEPGGDTLDYSTYLGGNFIDEAFGIAVDETGAAYVVGMTLSSNFPHPNAVQGTLNGTIDGFVSKLDPTGASLEFSSFLGGSQTEQLNDVAVSSGGVYVAGITDSDDFPTVAPWQSAFAGGYDGVVAALPRDGSALLWSTYLGGSDMDEALAVATDVSGTPHVVGRTRSVDFPVLDAIQATNGGGFDVFATKADAGGAVVLYSTYLGGDGDDEAYAAATDPTGALVVTGGTGSSDFPVVNPIQGDAPGSDVFVARLSCGSIQLGPPSLPNGTQGQPYSQTFTASGGSAPYSYQVASGSLPPGLGLSQAGVLSGTPATPGTFTFVVAATDSKGCAAQQPYTLVVSRGRANVATGEGLALPNPNRVRVHRQDGTPTPVDFLAYGAGAWGVNVGGADLLTQAEEQLLTGPGPGSQFGPQVRAFLFDGSPMAKVNYYAYGTLRYGVNVASAALDSDPFAELLTGAGPGDVFGPHVRGWNFDATAISPMAKLSFFSYSTLRFGANVAGGDLDGDLFHELSTGPGPGPIFGPQVRGFDYDGNALASIASINFLAFSVAQYGVNLATDDVDVDGMADIACTPGPGSGSGFPSRFKGFSFVGMTISPLAGFDVTTSQGTSYGGRVGLRDVSGDGGADLLTGLGPDPSSNAVVSPYLYAFGILTPLTSFDPFPGEMFGVNVAGAFLGY